MIRKISGCMAACMLLFSGSSGAAAIGTYGTGRAFDKFMATTTGTGAQTIKFSGSGIPLASAPTAAAVTLGNAGVVADSASKGLIVSGTATLPLTAAGLAVPVAMTGKVSGADLAMAVGTLVGLSGGALGFAAVALTLGIPMINKWLDSSSIETGGPTGFQKRDTSLFCASNCFLYQVSSDIGSPTFSAGNAVADWIGYQNSHQGPGYSIVLDSVAADGTNFQYHMTGPDSWVGGWSGRGISKISSPPYGSSSMTPISLPQVIATLPLYQPDPGVLKELFTIDQTGIYSDQTLKDLAITNVVATGPATVSGPSTLTSTAATPTAPSTQTTTKTDYNCVYVMADVTCNKTDTTSVQPVGIDPATNLPYPKTPTTTTTTDTPPVDSASDTPLPGAPKLYTPKYPDGLVGVWNTQSVTLKNSPLLHLLPSLMPNIGAGSGYPSFPITVEMLGTNFGSYELSPPGYVWDFLKWCVLICTAFLVRALIFGG